MRASLNAETAPGVDGRATAGHQGVPVKNNQQLEESSATARELGKFILAQLERSALFISAVLPNKVYPPMFNRYAEGRLRHACRQLGAHDFRRRAKLRTDLSATLLLTPPDSYEGGGPRD